MLEADRIRLQHMRDAVHKALQFARGRARTDLDADEMFALAIVRLLEIVGEAAKGVTQETRQRNPDVPWRQIAGTRDRLIHGYYDVDFDIVWRIVVQDLPPLASALDELLQAEPD